ncbi:hypothetical protein AB0942_20755 [Streptomyces nodosus]|uniref:hypothetical protein n=1 Tax=Streptomyces nodosus TaxID=40318 RepID=UPI003451316F
MAARRRRSAVTAALAAVAVFAAVGTSAGCGAAGRAIDCVGTADAIADGVTDLQQTVERTANEPTPTVTPSDLSNPSDPSGSPASPAPPVSPDSPASRDSHDTLHSLDSLEEKLEGFGGETDDVDVGKAVDALRESVGAVREAVEGGESSPDLGPVTDAAGELTKACTA